jgi:hypothetical protein
LTQRQPRPDLLLQVGRLDVMDDCLSLPHQLLLVLMVSMFIL